MAARSEAKRQGWLDMVRTPGDEMALRSGYRFDRGRAEHAANFAPTYLCYTKDEKEGEPFELLDWERDDLILPFFGWVHPDGYRRRFTEIFLFISKKNGKTTITAVIHLYVLTSLGEQRAHNFCYAVDRPQAAVCWDEAAALVKASPVLSDRLVVKKHIKRIEDPATDSYFQAMTGDGSSSSGPISFAVSLDETHRWNKPSSLDVYTEASGSNTAHSSPIKIETTTAGDLGSRLCLGNYNFSKSVLKGDVECHHHLPCIYEMSDPEKHDDPKQWKLANPSMGVLIKEDAFAAKYKAWKKDPILWNKFQRLHLNLWLDNSSPFVDMKQWDASEMDTDEFERLVVGLPCWMGADIARIKDTSSFCVVWFDYETDRYFVRSWIYLPGLSTERYPDQPFDAWHDSEYMVLTTPKTCDYGRIRGDISEVAMKYNVQAMAYDPHIMQDVASTIEDEVGIEVVTFRQSASNYNGPMNELSKRITEGQLIHENNPAFRWQVENLTAKPDNYGNYRPVKPDHDDTRKIDASCAMIMGLALAMQGDTGESVYESRGLLEL